MKFKSLIIVLLVGCMGLILSACNESGKSQATKQSQTSQTKSTDTSSTQKSQTNSNTSSKKSSNSDPYLLLVRMDGVINATLQVESKKPQTTVNYKLRTMTQNGKKISFSLIPGAKHQNDFQEGSIKEIVANGDSTDSNVLYNYKIDNANNVSLIDPASNKVIYKTAIQDPSVSNPTTSNQ